MNRTFKQTALFSKQWDNLGFTDDDLRGLESELLINPEKGDIIQGTGGLRKMRYAFENQGKSGSARVCYVDFIIYDTVYLITVYSKKIQESLNASEKKYLKQLVKNLERKLQEGAD